MTTLEHPQTVPADQNTTDTHVRVVGGNTTPTASQQTSDDQRWPPGSGTSNLLGDHPSSDAHHARVAEDLKPRNGHSGIDVHRARAVAATAPEPTSETPQPNYAASVRASTSPTATVQPAPGSHPPSGTRDSATDQMLNGDQPSVVGGAPSSPAPATNLAAPNGSPPVLVDFELAVLAERVNDLEEFRKASSNQLSALTRGYTPDKDGKTRGYGLRKNHPAVLQSASIVYQIKAIEDDAVKRLQKKLKASPLGPWVLSQKGIGAKTIARLLAATGDPYWNDLHGRPRTVSELWAYCGYRPGLRKQKGVKANWSAPAKMRAFNCIEPVKQQLRKPCVSLKDDDGNHIGAVHVADCRCSPWRVIYDEAKAKYVGSVHSEECHRCTGKGQPPAEVGSPRKPAHIDQMAIRVATKALLKELWREAKRLHEPPADHDYRDAQVDPVGGAQLPGDHAPSETQRAPVAGPISPEESR